MDIRPSETFRQPGSVPFVKVKNPRPSFFIEDLNFDRSFSRVLPFAVSQSSNSKRAALCCRAQNSHLTYRPVSSFLAAPEIATAAFVWIWRFVHPSESGADLVDLGVGARHFF